MLDALTNSVLPVFAMAALGMLSKRFGYFSVVEANVLSRFIYFIPAPILLFRLLATADLSGFDWQLLAGYVGTEVVVYVAVTALLYYGLKRSFRESFMLGVATVFANHVLYLLPIAIFRFGEGAAAEMVTFIAADVVVIYGATLVLLDATSTGRSSVAAVAGRLVRNPQIVAMTLGLLANFLAVPFDNGFGTFTQFAGNAAAPCSLFALGIILAAQEGKADWRAVAIVSVTKLIVLPVMLALVVLGFLGFSFEQADMVVLISTAPSGVMSFVLAIRYGVPARDISLAVLATTLLSVFSVSVALQLF